MYYSQHTHGYKSIKLGTCTDSLWSSSCFLTSFCNLGKELEWFDYTPVAMNKIFIQNKLFSNGCMLVCPAVATYFKKTYQKLTEDPLEICIAETDHYKSNGFPQHFFVFEKGMILDPLDTDPKWKKNTYHIVSYRLFKQAKVVNPVNTTKPLEVKAVDTTSTVKVVIVPKEDTATPAVESPKTPQNASTSPVTPEVPIDVPPEEVEVWNQIINFILKLKNMKGLNVQETMLAASTSLISLGMTLVVTDVWKGLALVVVGAALVYVRGAMKSE